jgi:hypothetical protein
VPDRLAHLFGGVQAREHDPGGAVVEYPADADAGIGLHPHDHRDAIGGGHRDGGAELLLPAGAVLEVEQQPVEPGSRAHLGRDR